jgi:hypothetical protein
MTTKQAYKQKMEAELELAQAKLAEFKAQAKSAAADTQIKHAKEHGSGSFSRLSKAGCFTGLKASM